MATNPKPSESQRGPDPSKNADKPDDPGHRNTALTIDAFPTSSGRHMSLEGKKSSKNSFKQWHKSMKERMQEEYEIHEDSVKEAGFESWKCCRVICKPCHWFDSISYNKELCKWCFKFKTFKLIGTIILIGSFTYTFLFSILKNELLPGGTIFFMFVMFSAAFIMGYLLMFAGLPSIIGNLLVGIVFGNVPENWLPPVRHDDLEEISQDIEAILLVIALIRAGLLLDISRIKGRVRFIMKVAFFPFFCEFLTAWIIGHLCMDLPWNWSALQGSVLCIVSLASVTSTVVKNKQTGYGEEKNLSSVLIAASAFDVLTGIFVYLVCLYYIFDQDRINGSTWDLILVCVNQVLVGVSVGIVCGILIAFFPDKRHIDAAPLRILIIGIASFAIVSILKEFGMTAAGVLGALTMCLVASNLWEELGWQESSNPVQYFYAMLYYFGQPAALSLIGYSMNFVQSDGRQIGMSCLVIIVGLLARETACFLSTMGTLYPTTLKEKIYICIAWFSKGTFQAVLAYLIEYIILRNIEYFNEGEILEVLKYSRIIRETTVLAILMTAPLAAYTLTLATPLLLTKKVPKPPPHGNEV